MKPKIHIYKRRANNIDFIPSAHSERSVCIVASYDFFPRTISRVRIIVYCRLLLAERNNNDVPVVVPGNTRRIRDRLDYTEEEIYRTPSSSICSTGPVSSSNRRACHLDTYVCPLYRFNEQQIGRIGPKTAVSSSRVSPSILYVYRLPSGHPRFYGSSAPVYRIPLPFPLRDSTA